MKLIGYPYRGTRQVRFLSVVLLGFFLGSVGCRSKTLETAGSAADVEKVSPPGQAPLDKRAETENTEDVENERAASSESGANTKDVATTKDAEHAATTKDVEYAATTKKSPSTAKRYAVSGPLDAAAAPAAAPAAASGHLWAEGVGTSGQGFGAGHGRLSGLGLKGSGAGGGGAARAMYMIAPSASPNTEAYAATSETGFVRALDQPLSTFSADVDTASYANVRRFLSEGRLPPPDAVRVEEMLNYFDYAYPSPTLASPFGVHTEVTSSPFVKERKLVHVGIKTARIAQESVPPRNLVFLLDVSGSMQGPDRLGLLQRSMTLLTRQLRQQDRVSMVVYAGASGVVLPSTSGAKRETILAALSKLSAGGSTNGASGIKLAYELARKQYQRGGINRVILATDGDFNVGTTSEGELVRLIETERESGVFLTVLGFGRGNLKDATMEKLADTGNGNYAYIDSLSEARRVLVEQSGATLVTVAKDVKFQVEFNPKVVEEYRLIGYENRRLAAEDFNDDTKDAGDMGAGHTVTALYEIKVRGEKSEVKVDPLKYQGERPLIADDKELCTVKLRYKEPTGRTSQMVSSVVSGESTPLEGASEMTRFAAAVTEFALLLSGSKHAPGASYKHARTLAEGALGARESQERRELIRLIQRAEALDGG